MLADLRRARLAGALAVQLGQQPPARRAVRGGHRGHPVPGAGRVGAGRGPARCGCWPPRRTGRSGPTGPAPSSPIGLPDLRHRAAAGAGGAAAAARRPGRRRRSWTRSGAARTTCASWVHPLPRYGDEDGGFALRLHADPAPGAGPAPGRGGRGDRRRPGRQRRPRRRLAGRARARRGPPLGSPSAARRGDRYAADGGLVVLRRGGRRLTMDVGPLGYLSPRRARPRRRAGGHPGRPATAALVDDPGTGSYYAEPAWRDAFRGTRAHATVAVDDVDQSVSGGAFLWVRHAVTTVRSGRPGGAAWSRPSTTATPGSREPVTHRRYLLAPPDRHAIAVVDLLHRRRHAPDPHQLAAAPRSSTVRTDGAAHVVDRAGTPGAADRHRRHRPGAGRGRCTATSEQRLGWWSRLVRVPHPGLAGRLRDRRARRCRWPC